VKPLTQLFVVTLVAVTITDAVVFYHLRQHPHAITVPFALLVIGITLLPVTIRYAILLRRPA